MNVLSERHGVFIRDPETTSRNSLLCLNTYLVGEEPRNLDYNLNLKSRQSDFSGGPVVKILGSQCRGPGLIPCQRTNPHATTKTWHSQIKRKKKKKKNN